MSDQGNQSDSKQGASKTSQYEAETAETANSTAAVGVPGKAEDETRLESKKIAPVESVTDNPKIEPLPTDFTVFNLEKDGKIIAQANFDLDDSWDLLISSGSGNLGPVSSGGTATYGK